MSRLFSAWFNASALDDKRIGAIVIGPGLGRDDAAAALLDAALAADAPLIIDGDALHLLDQTRLGRVQVRAAPTIFTPHEGEFDTAFGASQLPRIERAQAAATHAKAIIVFKGANTIIAAPNGTAIVTPPADSWLSTAGTGDVLTGAIAAMVAARETQEVPLPDRVAAGVWLHSAAARRAGGAFIADDLARALSVVRAAA